MVIRPGSKFDQYHPPCAELKNEWSYVSSPSIRFHGVDRATLRLP